MINAESEESPGVYLRDDPLLGTQLQNQSELRAPTAEKAAFYLDAALAARTDASSPDARFSHLLYTLHVYQYSVDRNPSRTGSSGHATGGSAGSGVAGGRSRLHLLDLGSCQQTGRPNGNGQSSANNMTLSGLGNVLVALFNGQRHLPHREHKITQVLRECLGSLTCQAALVAHVAASSAYSETLSTVQMASRVHRMRRRRMKVSCSVTFPHFLNNVVTYFLLFRPSSTITLDRVAQDQVAAAKIPVDWACLDLRVARVPLVDQLIHRAANSHVTRSSTSARSTTPPMANIRPFIYQVSIQETIVVPCLVR